MQFVSLPWARPALDRVLDGAVLLGVAGITVGLPALLAAGTAAWSPLVGTAGFLVVAVLMRLSRRVGVQLALGGCSAAVLAGWAVLSNGQLATANDLQNVIMPLAPVFPAYAGHVYARDRRRAWIMTAALTVVAVHPWSTTTAAAAGALLWVCAPLMVGCYLAARAQYVDTLANRAANAERDRDLRAEQARTGERVRLAADLHDVVTHRVSLMVLHAGAVRVTAVDPIVRDTAETVRAIGCDALDELRDLIGVLRNTSRSPGDSAHVPPDAEPDPVTTPNPRRGIRRADVGVGVAAVVWTVLLTVVVMLAPSPTGMTERPMPWVELLIQLPAAAALSARRTYPHLVVLITTVDALVLLTFTFADPAVAWVATSASTTLILPAVTPLATYAVAVHSRRPLWGAALVLLLTVIAARPWAPHVPVVTVATAFVALPALLGLYVGARRRLIDALVERADRAYRHRQLLVERVRTEERIRLAEEMHGIVATSVRDMVERADQLDGLAGQDAAELIATGRQALDELHGLVDTLRTVETEPLPAGETAAELDRLAAASASVGMPVDLATNGDPLSCSPAVVRTVNRIVGEALTNARKHALGAPLTVRVGYGREQVRVEVRNGAPPADRATAYRSDAQLAAGGSGTGLRGLQQRVQLVDGTFDAGPTTEGGFTVDAILPSYVPTTTRKASSR